jgi:hypothetical protein
MVNSDFLLIGTDIAIGPHIAKQCRLETTPRISADQ